MKLSERALGLIGLLGGLGGAINAWLCYAKLPVPVGVGGDVNGGDAIAFSWLIIPAGCIHGGLLALASVWLALFFRDRKPMIRWMGLPIAGWISGWLSYIPLSLYIAAQNVWGGLYGGTSPSPQLLGRVLESLMWPIGRDRFWGPYVYFGLVGAIYHLCLNLCRRLHDRRLLIQVMFGCLSGVLGSLWWWIIYEPWYFSLLHGMIWGSLVGFGVWKAQRNR